MIRVGNILGRSFSLGLRLSRGLSTEGSAYENLILEKLPGNVALITLNRPKSLNALCSPLISDLLNCCSKLDADPTVSAIVLNGAGKSFAAGADIKEMSPHSFPSTYMNNFLAFWQNLSNISSPIIAGVHGFCLGGGLELAMLCDIIYATSDAKFGQPEVKLGTIPGCGGTQRLIRSVGKSKAMEMILSGRMVSAAEVHKFGLVSQIFETKEEMLKEAIKLAEDIGKNGRVAVRMAKESVKFAEETGLSDGLKFEMRMFHSTFGTKDRKEGMEAFSEKRKPNFIGE